MMRDYGGFEVAFVTLAFILAGGLVVLALLGARTSRRSKRWALRSTLKQLDRQEATVGRLERVARLGIIHALLQGRKCRGCGVMVKVDDLKSVGEDPKGREVELCLECRKLMGQED